MSFSPHSIPQPIMSQEWRNVTFLHWRIDTKLAASLMPRGVIPDEYDGSSWVGLVPFTLCRTRFGRSPVVPFFGTFHETNVRLYAQDQEGRRGVVFLSLDAERFAAVLTARLAFGLPYRWSSMSCQRRSDSLLFAARRHSSSRHTCDSRVEITPGVRIAKPDAQAEFLTARWALFSQHRGRTIFLPNRHEPWPLHHAELNDFSDTLLARAGLPGVAARPPDSVLFSPGVHTVFGAPQPLRE